MVYSTSTQAKRCFFQLHHVILEFDQATHTSHVASFGCCFPACRCLLLPAAACRLACWPLAGRWQLVAGLAASHSPCEGLARPREGLAQTRSFVPCCCCMLQLLLAAAAPASASAAAAVAAADATDPSLL